MELFYKLLPPLLALLSGIAFTAILFYEKGGEAGIFRWVIWLVWATLLFAVIGFAASRIESLIAGFLTVTFTSLFLGILYLVVAPITLPWWKRGKISDVFLAGFALYFVGMAGYMLVYNLLQHENPFQYLLLAGSPVFILPAFALKSYDFWGMIPPLRYRTWAYPVHEPVPRLLPVDTMKVTMNFTPVPGKTSDFEGYEVEYPSNVALGELFHYFISFHNKHREYRKTPIQYVADNHAPLEWMLFKYSPARKKIFLDTEKTLIENDVRANEVIYATSTYPLNT